MDHFDEVVDKAVRLNLSGVELFAQVGDGVARREYNGIGPAYFPDELRSTVTKWLRIFEPAALIHDLRNYKSDGMRWAFHYANREFLENCRKCADDAYPWYSWRRYRARWVARLLFRFVDGQPGWVAWMNCYSKKKGNDKMKKQMMLAAVAAMVAGITGCKSIEVERRAQTLATIQNADGTVSVVRDKESNPVVLDGGWEVDYFQHWNWQRFDSLNATAGKDVSLAINNYEGGADATNLTQLVHTSLDGMTKLVATAADAYVKVAGGGAQADTAINVAGKIAKYFSDKGGDVSKATVTTDTAENVVKVSDGTTSVQCDAAGNCSDCETK